MLKIPAARLAKLDSDDPGLRETILAFEALDLPPCPACSSTDTATVQTGIIGRTIALAGATTKVKLFPNSRGPDTYFCNQCELFFHPPDLPPSMSAPR